MSSRIRGRKHRKHRQERGLRPFRRATAEHPDLALLGRPPVDALGVEPTYLQLLYMALRQAEPDATELYDAIENCGRIDRGSPAWLRLMHRLCALGFAVDPDDLAATIEACSYLTKREWRYW